MKTKWQSFKDVFSWIILFAMVGLLIFTSVNAFKAQKSGESNFLFGYRPVLVLTGSMEPYMMTNSIALTKEVTDMDQLEVGDVVTYHAETTDGRLIRITHRIIDIEGDLVYTKGDNNRVADGYGLTLENIEAEVLTVFNQTAWLAAKWQTLTGKIFLISCGIFLVSLYMLLKFSVRTSRESRSYPPLTVQDPMHQNQGAITETSTVQSDAEPASRPE